MARGLLLDLDGTLADSLGVLKQVYYDFLHRHGAAGSEAEFDEMNGPPIARVVDLLHQRHGLPGTADEALERYHAMLAEAHEASLPAEAAAPLLAAAEAHGWRTAVVTSATRRSAESWLQRHGLAAQIAVIVGGDEVTRGKPDPEPYRLAMELLGVEPADSIAIEDSRSGAAAARAAGLPTYALAVEPDPDQWPEDVRFLPSLGDAIALVSC